MSRPGQGLSGLPSLLSFPQPQSKHLMPLSLCWASCNGCEECLWFYTTEILGLFVIAEKADQYRCLQSPIPRGMAESSAWQKTLGWSREKEHSEKARKAPGAMGWGILVSCLSQGQTGAAKKEEAWDRRLPFIMGALITGLTPPSTGEPLGKCN